MTFHLNEKTFLQQLLLLYLEMHLWYNYISIQEDEVNNLGTFIQQLLRKQTEFMLRMLLKSINGSENWNTYDINVRVFSFCQSYGVAQWLGKNNGNSNVCMGQVAKPLVIIVVYVVFVFHHLMPSDKLTSCLISSLIMLSQI